jgi:hypothetical protein
LNTRIAQNQGNDTVESDNNGDGKTDAVFYYERGIIARTEHDRNFDGKPDHWEWYESGIASRGESDDNFDGKIDGWFTYQDGNWWLSKHDTDANGVPDVFQSSEYGVINLVVWRPNEASKPTRIEFFNAGVKEKELSDTDSDGLLDTVSYFDVFQNQTSKQNLPEPLEPNKAIADRHKM